jgi:hypothetical protein
MRSNLVDRSENYHNQFPIGLAAKPIWIYHWLMITRKASGLAKACRYLRALFLPSLRAFWVQTFFN